MNSCPVQLYGARFRTDPGALYRQMRSEHGPVVPVLMEDDVPAWLVIGYRELHHVLSTPSMFARKSDRWNAWDQVPQNWPRLPMVMEIPTLLYSEGEEHRRRSTAVSAVLSAVDLHELRVVSTRMADRLIDAFCGSTGTDLRSSYTARLPALVLSWLYGLDDRRGDHMAELMTDMIDGGESAMRAQGALMEVMGQLVVERRSAPGADVVSRLLAHPAGYSDEEAVPELIVLLGGGNQPTAEWVGNALRLMLTDDRFSDSLAGARSSIRDALNEVLWEDTPTQIHAGRYATQDVELGGRLIRKGDMILLGLSGANRDPAVRPTDDGRSNHAHLSFSHGGHQCPYPAQEIAENIAVTAIEVLLDRLPDLELAVPESELRWRPSPWMRGVDSLPVTFTPAPRQGEY